MIITTKIIFRKYKFTNKNFYGWMNIYYNIHKNVISREHDYTLDTITLVYYTLVTHI